jgi:hypothetical protein
LISAFADGGYSLVFDALKNLYIGEIDGIKKVSPAGISSRVAGSGGTLANDGGQAIAAAIGRVTAMAFDSGGSLYFTDSQNHRVRRIAPSGIITTLAGNGTAGFSGDGGLATSAQVNSPEGIAVDAVRNVYFCDAANHRVRRISPDGIIRTVAGTGTAAFSGDGGPAIQAMTLSERLAPRGFDTLLVHGVGLRGLTAPATPLDCGNDDRNL